MRLILFFLLIFLSVSCREEVASWDTLSDVDREYIKNRAQLKCLEGSEGDFEALKARSLQLFTTGTDITLVRNATWKIEYKKADEVLATSLISVWKLDGDSVYLIWRENQVGSSPVFRFLKITATTNAEMFEDFQDEKCRPDTDATVIQSSSAIIVTMPVVNTRNDSTTVLETTSTYTLNSVELAFFGLFHEAKTVNTLDNDGNITKTEKYTMEATRLDTPDLLPATYTDLIYSAADFCIMDYSARADSRPNDYRFPYLASTLNCSPAPGEFDPASELPL